MKHIACLLALACLFAGRSLAKDDVPPCVAVMASFPEELTAIEQMLALDASQLQTTEINGIKFTAADVGGKRCVFFLTGMSEVNAASSTQLVIDRFNAQAVFFTGIAGGVNPALSPGDVVIPAQWCYHGEGAYFNETAPGKYNIPGWFPNKYPNFGMIHPDEVQVIREGWKDYQRVTSFPADPELLAVAQKAVAAMPPMKTGGKPSKVTVGGVGVIGTVFCDNAEYRKWVYQVWKADCLDMESTAIAQVCWQNKKPCLIVRGLSDLAGGQTGANEMEIYLKAAAEHSAAVLVEILKAHQATAKP